MNIRRTFAQTSLPRQRGVVLLVSLLFLVVLTLIGVAASRMVTSEERQSRYLREYNTAFQAAESALRDMRDDIDGVLASGDLIPSIDLQRFNSNTKYFPDCKYGQCEYDQSGSNPPWRIDANWANAVPFGTYTRRSPLPQSQGGNAALQSQDFMENEVDRVSTATATTNVTGVYQQPAALVEPIPLKKNSEDFAPKSAPTAHRITARGFGADPNSRATVQEIYCNPALCAGF
jgi:type IV pilus assembly protein PilX